MSRSGGRVPEPNEPTSLAASAASAFVTGRPRNFPNAVATAPASNGPLRTARAARMAAGEGFIG